MIPAWMIWCLPKSEQTGASRNQSLSSPLQDLTTRDRVLLPKTLTFPESFESLFPAGIVAANLIIKSKHIQLKIVPLKRNYVDFLYAILHPFHSLLASLGRQTFLTR